MNDEASKYEAIRKATEAFRPEDFEGFDELLDELRHGKDRRIAELEEVLEMALGWLEQVEAHGAVPHEGHGMELEGMRKTLAKKDKCDCCGKPQYGGCWRECAGCGDVCCESCYDSGYCPDCWSDYVDYELTAKHEECDTLEIDECD